MPTQLVTLEIEQYAQQMTSKPSDPLQDLAKATQAGVHQPQMLSGHLQGRLLSMISKMLQPRTILEIGTYTGYSAICLAEGLKDDGVLHTIDKDGSLKPMCEQYIADAGMKNKIVLHTGEAKEIIPTLPQEFDLVFIDADKQGYRTYYDLLIERLPAGAVILADNVLFSGEVILPEEQQSKSAKALHLFNEYINADNRVEQLLLPLRDGIMMIRKK